MSDTINVAFVKQYRDNILSLYQQRGPKLRGLVREESLTGDAHFFERLGPTAAIRKSTRHGDTPLVNSQHTRRMVVTAPYEWADLIDKEDKVRMLIDPQSEYAQNAAMALGRAFDDVVIAAFDGDAKTGVDGSTTVTFANDGRAAPVGDRDFSSAAITTQDLLKVKKDLDDKDVPMEDRYLVHSPSFLEQILKQSSGPNALSSDYNTVRALVRGELDSWLGFRWIQSTRLPSPATNMRYCFAWHRDSMGVAVAADFPNGKVDVRPDKSYSVQVYASGDFGATRIQGEGVVRMKIDETK